MIQSTQNFLHENCLGDMQRRKGDTMQLTHFTRLGRHRSRHRSHEHETYFLQ